MLTFNIWRWSTLKFLDVLSKEKTNTALCSVRDSRRSCSSAVNSISTDLKPPWSVVFFGTDDFALQSLQRLFDEYKAEKLLCRLEVVSAYKGKENSVIRFTKKHNIPLHNWQPTLNFTEFHIGLVVSFGHLIPMSMIHSFPLGMINVHGSLLPRWRGAAPIVYALMNGDHQTGVSIMKIMPKKFDIGEILAQRSIDIHPDETMPELRHRMAKLGANLMLDTISQLPGILTLAKPQSEHGVTYAPKVTSKLSYVKWNDMTAKNVYDLQRALHDLYPLTTKFMGSMVKLLDVRIHEEPPGLSSVNKAPGLVLYSKKTNRLSVLCAQNSWISVNNIGYPGRPPMSARDFNNGFLSKQQPNEAFFVD